MKDNILCFRSGVFETEQAKGKGKASGNRHQKATFGPFYARPGANKKGLITKYPAL